MRAALLEAVGQPFTVVADVDLAPPEAGEVDVRVTHCGLCHSDLHYQDGNLTGPLPMVLGHEATGVVERLGAGVTGLAEGDRVVLTMRPSCGRCYWCVRGEVQLCPVGAAMLGGSYADGGTRLSRGGETVYRGLVLSAFAERTVVPEAAAVRIDDDVPPGIAAVLGCAVQTGVGAVLNTAAVEPGATVMVIGLGGVGTSIVQGARIAGAGRIVGVDTSAARREQALGLGATDVVDPAETPADKAAKALTGGIGVDYGFDAVGRAAVTETLLKATRAGGTVVMVGVPPTGEDVTVRGLIHNVAEKKLVGCYLGSANPRYEFGRLIGLWRSGRLDLAGTVTGTRPLAEINEAVADMRAGRGLRTVLTP
ncbi:MAG: Zn-dependent alcohol dehydrogenase [Mycobacteriales bacterium]